MTDKTPPAAGQTSSVRVKLLDPLGASIAGLKYEILDGKRIVAKGITDAKGNIAAFVSNVGTELSLQVERFATEEMKHIKTLVPWAEDYRVKLVSAKIKATTVVQNHKGSPGQYQRKTHIVNKGDTLSALADRYQTTPIAIARINGIQLSSILQIGQVLKLPPQGERGPVTKPASASSPTPAPTKIPPAPAQTALPPAPAGPVSTPPSAVARQQSDYPTPELSERGSPASAPAPVDLTPEDIKGKTSLTPEAASDPVQALEPQLPKQIPIVKELPTEKSADRGENGTPKTVLKPVCEQQHCLKVGDKGPLVEEVNIRLLGFGGTIEAPEEWDTFTSATEKAVRQFQRDFMGVAETGRVCGAVLASLDVLRDKYTFPWDPLKCPCGTCGGFGQGRMSSQGFAIPKLNGAIKQGVEYPGFHRGLFYAMKAALFYTHKTDATYKYAFSAITSGYRCWKRNMQKNRPSTNHMGNAVDMVFNKGAGTGVVRDGALETMRKRIFIDRMGAQLRWPDPNKISLEDTGDGADSWVHMDVREFNARYKKSHHFAKHPDLAKGKTIVEIARDAGHLGLINCGGLMPPTKPATAPVGEVGVSKSSEAKAPALTAPAPKAPAPTASAAKPKANEPDGKYRVITAEIGQRKPAKSLQVSEHGLLFIAEWEGGKKTPYPDSKKYCTIGVGHLIDGHQTCEALAEKKSPKYMKMKNGISEQQMMALFKQDVERIRAQAIVSIQKPVFQHEFDALISLAFNCGSLVKFKKLLGHLNTENYTGCCKEFEDITDGGDKGLVKRRKSEMKLFLTAVYDARH
ncbi:LysM peptidoglycan-binding domain-containing protein [Massilia sp. PAMC28688]|uniref:glycoside hydrolase family protein n=1 Tax=Massilia sp. PAMC28688 TaxID=2861283 RepID=UPI001C62DBF1|nr:LysM peptidoglycan-binding domain-containing protein [Massilia sp. PAMC28688]QYF95423.1 LysM peptidoglycan-binding domain-containing protein [Massilia sp. PAMC28688]